MLANKPKHISCYAVFVINGFRFYTKDHKMNKNVKIVICYGKCNFGGCSRDPVIMECVKRNYRVRLYSVK